MNFATFLCSIVFLTLNTALITACQTQNILTEAPVLAPVTHTAASATRTPISEETAPLQTENLNLIELGGTKGPVYSLAWSPDGKMLASAGFAGIRIWDAESLEEIQVFEEPQSFVWGLTWLSNGSGLSAAAQDGLWVWPHIEAASVRQLDKDWYFSVSESPDQSLLAVGDASGELSIWDMEKAQAEQVLEGTSLIIAVAWSPKGDRIATGNISGQIKLYKAPSWEEIDVSEINSQPGRDVNGLAWSPDGSLLAAARQDGTVLVWDTTNDKIRFVLEGHHGWARGLAWSPDGKTLASAGEDGMLKLWSIETAKLIHDLKIASKPLWSVSWSPDGKQIAVGTGLYNNKTAESSIFVWSP